VIVGAVYDDLETFYHARAARRDSPEYGYGDEWQEANGTYRVSWASTTGEIYAVALGPPTSTAGQDFLMFSSGQASGRVDVLGAVAAIAPEHRTQHWHGERHVNDVVLSGWATAGHELAWVRDRVARAEQLLDLRVVTRFEASGQVALALLGALGDAQRHLDDAGVDPRDVELEHDGYLGEAATVTSALYVLVPEDAAAAAAVLQRIDEALATVDLPAGRWAPAPRATTG